MSNYKEMYLKMFRASEQAANILIKAQRECEELFLSQCGDEPVQLSVVPKTIESEKQ